ncbi:MAG: DUF115 domain-containing protein [Oscillospiraceae bacterium]|nr:DUF115 domain-containing protein [Oscillospiraceae bacterium]
MEFIKMDFKAELAKVSPKLRRGANIYIWGTGHDWEHIRKLYKLYKRINLEDSVYAFIDNDPLKQGTEYYGKKVISPDEIDIDNAVVIVSLANYLGTSVIKQLIEMGFHFKSDCFDRVYFYFMLRRFSRLQFSQFENKHKGERCFIIGNGPSLKTQDLDLLKNEFTFATNQIYLAFEETAWRPTYYVVEDDMFMETKHKEFCNIITGIKFLASHKIPAIESFEAENAYYYNVDADSSYQQLPYKLKFSIEPGLVYHCDTVTYTCLQFAAFMGFKEIYLLGVDNSYSVLRKADGEIIYKNQKQNHFNQNYSASHYIGDIDLVNAGYQAAREYADNNDIKIYNATRAGELEVFERVTLEDIL